MVAAVDKDETAVQETAREILDRIGMGIGVAGSGERGTDQGRPYEARGNPVVVALDELGQTFGGPAAPEQVTEEVGVLSNSLSELVRAAGDHAKYDRRAIHEHWRIGFSYTDMAGKYAAYYERILDGEDLHPAPIQSPVVRQKKLFDWRP